MSEFVAIGKIKKPHGLLGSLYVFPLTNDERRFDELERVFLNDSNQTELTISKVKYTP